jgi:MFS transporter, putative metabolite:H+ symporter
MLSVANSFQTIGFYGFANWVPTLLIATGIPVSQTLEYSGQLAVRRPHRAQLAGLPVEHRDRGVRRGVPDRGGSADHLAADNDERVAVCSRLTTSSRSCFPHGSAPGRSDSSIPGVDSARSSPASSSRRFYRDSAFQGFSFSSLERRGSVLSIAVFGPRTNHRSLEEISRGVPRGGNVQADRPV